MNGNGGLGIRARTTVAYALIAVVVAGVASLLTYVTARHYLLNQRASVALRLATTDSQVVQQMLDTNGTNSGDSLAAITPRTGSQTFLHNAGQWYSASLSAPERSIPASLLQTVPQGRAALQWARSDGQPVIAVGVPLAHTGVELYQVTVTDELATTLTTLRWVATVFPILAALAGGLIGFLYAARVLRPLAEFADAAGAIGSGALDTRLPTATDSDLAVIVAAFNTMADALSERIERDARFVADVGHELRSPLTTLTTSVGLLSRRRGALDDDTAGVVELLAREVGRLEQTLQDLLELARIDANAQAVSARRQLTDVSELVGAVLQRTGRNPELLELGATGAPLDVLVDRERFSRVLVNLLDNADLHGGGVVRVVVSQAGASVLVHIVDDGPGIAPEEQGVIFERFRRGRRSGRASLPGSGLGLAISRDLVRSEGGELWCESTVGRGSRFSVALPCA